MYFISIIAIVVLFVICAKLSNRVSRLERKLKKSHHTPAVAVKSPELRDMQYEIQDELGDDLLAYVKSQINDGEDRDEIIETLVQSGWEKHTALAAVAKIEESKTMGESPISGMSIDQTNDIDESPSWFNELCHWLATDWLMKLGALLMLIGLGWLTSYAFLNNWIDSIGRITLGIITGIAILLLGEWRIRRFVHQGAVLLSLGATTILLTIFAAREIYGFFTPVTALGVMFIAVVFVALSSVRHKSLALAVLSVILGSIAPLFTNSDIMTITMFVYLLIISAGTLWVVMITGWRKLAPLSLVIMALYSSCWICDGIPNYLETEILFLSFIFAVLYFATNVAAMIKSSKIVKSDLFVAVANGFLLLWWIYATAPEVFLSLITAAWAAVFAIGAFGIFKLTNRREPFFVYASVATAMLAAATAFELSGPALTLAYIFEAGFIVVAAAFVLNSARIAQSLSLLLVAPAILSFGSMVSRSWKSGILHDDFFVLFSLAAVLLGLGAFFYSKRKVEHDPPNLMGTTVLFVAGALYVLDLIWLVLHAAADYDAATMISLVAYTLIGLYFYINGQLKSVAAFRTSGGFLLGFVFLRLMFVEVWKLDLTGKIITFILIGALLISSAFIGRLKKDNPKQENENI